MENINENVKTISDRARYIGRAIHISRKTINISATEFSGHMGITVEDLAQYESGEKQIPRSLLLELLMFGISRWSRR